MSKEKSNLLKLEISINVKEFKLSVQDEELIKKNKDRVESMLKNLTIPSLAPFSPMCRHFEFLGAIPRQEKRIRTKQEVQKERLKELSNAIINKLNNLEEIPYEWYDEYNDLKSDLDFYKENKNNCACL